MSRKSTLRAVRHVASATDRIVCVIPAFRCAFVKYSFQQTPKRIFSFAMPILPFGLEHSREKVAENFNVHVASYVRRRRRSTCTASISFMILQQSARKTRSSQRSSHSATRYVSQSTRNFVHLSRETRNFSNHRPIRKDALSRNRHVHSIPGRGEIYYRGEVTRTSEMLDG